MGESTHHEDLTSAHAEELLIEVTNWLDDYPVEAIVGLYAGRAWLALGYADWETLCRAEFGGRVALARPDRQELTAHLRSEGMSTRAIASAIGVGKSAVHRDIEASVPNGTVDEHPATIMGLDGKRRDAVVRPKQEDAHRPTPTTTPTPPPPYTPPTTSTTALQAGEPIVINMRDLDLRTWLTHNNHLTRIDRATKWGNPFILDDDGNRQQVINAYKNHYLPNKPSLTTALDELTGKALGCWCAPEPCHGDALLEAWWTR